MEKVNISIIVPVYNVEEYIKRCMDSLIDQSFEAYEIIVVNDGTKDNSMEYVYKLQSEYKNIIICEQENKGLSAARNTGIARAKGEYLIFCDSDDALEQNCLQKLYNEAINKNLDILLYDAKAFDRTEHEIMVNEYIRENFTEEVLSGREMLKELVDKKQYAASACMFLIKRKLIIENNLKFMENILHEDELFTPIVLITAKRVEHRGWPVYLRYIREGSIITSNNVLARMRSMEIVIVELIEFLRKQPTNQENIALRSIIIERIKFFLGQTLLIEGLDEELSNKRKRIRRLVKENHMRLGFEFECYVLWLRLKKLL